MNCSVLLVDSDRDQLEHFTQTLTRLGFQVTAAYDPRLALQAATFKPFNLALVAESLRGADGLDFADQLRRAQPNLRTVLLCDALGAEFEAEAKDRGVYACLLKSCEVWLLEETLELALDRFPENEPSYVEEPANRNEKTNSGSEALGVLPLPWPAQAWLN